VHTGVSPRIAKGGPPLGSTGSQWLHVRQNKHHRWSLDEDQINQYHLGGTLHPRVRWWEATEVPRKLLRVIEFGEGITMIGVVCEDLAQIDQVAEVVRSVGPSFVYTPLLDGPQLNTRWAARYASVLADDPGSAVLTLTSFGMAQRSRPGGRAASPVVALWKDPVRGAREIPLESGAEGVLLTICSEQTTRRSADGRWPIENSPLLYDVAVYQVRSSRAGAGAPERPSALTPNPPALGVHELAVLTSWAEGVAEALASAPDRLEATLSDAQQGAPWRAALGIEEPNQSLAEAIEWMVREVRAATRGSPSPAALLAAIRDDRPGERELHALTRRALRAMIEARVNRRELGKWMLET
jgi:hypothetical protein